MVASGVEVVVVGVGVPKFSMGWTHLFQLQRPPLTEYAALVGAVEPFFLSQAGHEAKGSDAFRSWAAENPDLPIVDECAKLPKVALGKVRVGVICVRTPDALRYFKAAVLDAGCSAVYLEKPGAGSVSELDDLIAFARQHEVAVMLGYSRNFGYAKKGAAFAEEQRLNFGSRPRVTLVHANPWREEDLPDCWERCQPGMLYDMACHDLAVAAVFFGLTSEYSRLRVHEGSVQATYRSIQDFIRLDFTVTPAGTDAVPLRFEIDRCAGAFNGMRVEDMSCDVESSEPVQAKFMSGEEPMFENPLPDLSPHLAVQYDYYVEAKRVFLDSVGTGSGLPEGAPTLETGRQVMLLADKLTAALKELVPERVKSSLD